MLIQVCTRGYILTWYVCWPFLNLNRCLISGQRNSEGDSTSGPGQGSAKEAREKWLREMFELADVNNDGLMDEEEAISLIKTLSDGVRNA